LFVDDDARIRAIFERLLRRHSIPVDTARTGDEATELARSRDYALVATDYVMPDVDGLTLIERLRKIAPEASYMVVSGRCSLEVAASALNKHKIASLITKPWDNGQLVAMIERGIGEARDRIRRRTREEAAKEKTRALEGQKRALEGVLATRGVLLTETLLSVLDLRTRETRAHCRRVAAYSQLLAGELGLHGDILVALRQGALLHDIGKLGVPDAILCKPSTLTAEEWQAMRQHCAMGARLLDGLDQLERAREIVLQHHERWDGRGYPQALAGNEIRIEARILSVADTIDAILSHRAYRAGGTLATVEREVVSGASSQFDPAVVLAFRAVDPEAWLRVRAAHPDENQVTVAA
jgi:putative nucleotidyltransferase with HDIG domain